jgi:hypothetical protein
MARVLAWVSGAASAVAAKLAPDAIPVTCDMGASEDADNARFLRDCEGWFGREIIAIKSEKYSDIDAVFEGRKYHAGISGAPCTGEMKVAPRLDFQRPSDSHVFGYTADLTDQKRARHFRESYPQLKVSFPLIERGLTKRHCFAILERAGIRRPRVYDMGFPNANCIGCVKASSPNYWALVRREFPEVFARRADQSRRFGSRLTRINNVRIFIDEIPEDWPVTEAIAPACDFLCQAAESEIGEAA